MIEREGVHVGRVKDPIEPRIGQSFIRQYFMLWSFR